MAAVLGSQDWMRLRGKTYQVAGQPTAEKPAVPKAACADCGADLGLVTYLVPLSFGVRRMISPPSEEAKPLESQPVISVQLPSIHASTHLEELFRARARIVELEVDNARQAVMLAKIGSELSLLRARFALPANALKWSK